MFTLGNVLYFGGLIFLIIGVMNIFTLDWSKSKLTACIILVILGIAGIIKGDDIRRKEVFSYTIDHYQDGFSNGDVQVSFKEEKTPRMIKANMIEKFKEKAAADGNPDTIELTRTDKKEYFE